jgi:opacity protein-like surface antigen
MTARVPRRRLVTTFAMMSLLGAAVPERAMAQASSTVQSAPGRIGVQGSVFAGINWPAADESFDATGLDERPIEFGGGVRVTEIWRALFAQVNATRWSSTGERAFVDESGTAVPLGIPLDVEATYIDVSAGWRFFPNDSATSGRTVSYFGAGVGVVKYSEKSPFAQPDDDLDKSATSYHVAAGVDVRLLSWLGIVGDVRYRYVPSLLGKEGVSAAFGEKDFGGFQAGIGLRLGVDGVPSRPPRRAEPAAPRPSAVELNNPANPAARPSGTIRSGVLAAEAPVFLLPDTTRTPLRVLPAGTSVSVLEESDGWLRVEFQDAQFGPRVGYVQSKFVNR